MDIKTVEISIYGAEQICASCVNLPSSIETFEWLEAAVTRKFPNNPFTFTYIDINQPPKEEEKIKFAKKVIDEDMFYPVAVINGKIVGEGNIRLKPIYAELAKNGFAPDEPIKK